MSSVETAVNINVNALLGAPIQDNSSLLDLWHFTEIFMRAPAANASIGVATNLDWELLGDTPTAALDDGGGVLLTTNSSAGQDTIIWPHQDAGQSAINALAWDLSVPTVFDTLIKPTAVAAQNLYAGFKLTAALDLTTDANAIFFYSTNGGNWQIATSIAGTDALVDTGVAPANATPQRLTMISGFTDASGTEQVRCFIDGVLVATVDSPTTGALKPFVGIEGNAQTAICRAIRLARQYD